MKRLAIATVLLATACTATTTAAQVSEPPTLRTCASAVQEEIDRGLEARTVTTGPVRLVAFHVSDAPAHSKARNFKVMLRLEPKTEITLARRTEGTALLFNLSAFRKDNAYSLADGVGKFGFASCADRPSVWVGSILTAGPTTVTLGVRHGDAWHNVQVSAYTPQ